MIDFPNIPENHFLEHNRIQLQRLAQDLRATGLSMNRISELTHMNWDTVYKAMNERPVRFDNAERLRYFIQWWKEHHAEETKPATPPRGKGGKFTKKNQAK